MFRKNLTAASAGPMVLAILTQGESYGYAILRRVEQMSNGDLEWTEGMLYPVLHRLESSKLIRSRWGRSPEGRRRRYYALTAEGEAALSTAKADWLTVHQCLSRLWKDSSCPA